MEGVDYLAGERRKAEFDVAAMKIVWAGSRRAFEISDRISKLVATDPALSKDGRTEMARKELFKNTLRKASYAWKKIIELRLTEEEALMLRFYIDEPAFTDLHWWWPGGLGKVSTHAIVYARLITDGKDHGVHGFIVQLRSLEDHKPLAGITIGDIGTKFGNGAYNTMDNGVLRFDHVRIPRDQMLMRVSQVTREGKYVQSEIPRQLLYGTMVLVRQSMVRDASSALSRAVCIATRYSAVRRQFGSRNGGQETQVARFLMKSVSRLGSGKLQAVGTIAYMGRIEQLMQCHCNVEQAKDWLKPSTVLEAFEARAVRMSVSCAKSLGKFTNPEEGFAELTADLAEAAVAHCQLIVVSK
nr:peroxisomal acyl-coenzyme A oxidase 1-like [Ipomoea batatas]